jgi:peptide deformylase
MNLGNGPFSIVNPEITCYSDQTFTLWDDCMSFPDLLVKVRRHESIGLRYTDEEGRERKWEILDRSESELLQHEMDHLDGILAIDRAIDKESIIYRAVFEEHRNFYLDQVD